MCDIETLPVIVILGGIEYHDWPRITLNRVGIYGRCCGRAEYDDYAMVLD
jgi:hypothetical protein